MTNIHTLGELRASGYRVRSVKDEMRENLLQKIARGEKTFPGIHGYDRTVIPATKQIFIPTKVINKDNVDEFSQQLKQLLGGS